jgi:hypothetical protein
MGIGSSWFAAMGIFLASTAFAMEMPVPIGKLAKLRAYEERQDGDLKRQVLVGKHLIPEGSLVELSLGEPLLYRWLLNDQGKIIQSSMPYFPAKVKSLPEAYVLPPEEREQILAGSFFVHIRDFDAALIVATLFNEALPEGIEKVNHSFAWDSFNPNGTWGHSLQRALRRQENNFFLTKPPTDMEDFCPRFAGLRIEEREVFWIALFNEIARHESAFIPLTASDEGAYDPANKGVISSGLSQISLRSSKAACYQERGCSLVKKQADLFQPDKNLRCAVGIMSCLSESAGCLSCKKGGKWKGIAAYWSTLRDPYEVTCTKCPSGKVTIGKKPQIKDALKASAAFCF